MYLCSHQYLRRAQEAHKPNCSRASMSLTLAPFLVKINRRQRLRKTRVNYLAVGKSLVFADTTLSVVGMLFI